MFLRLRYIACHQIGFADVLMRPLVIRVELEGLVVGSKGCIEVALLALRIAQPVLDVGVVRIGQRGFGQ